MKNTPFSDIHYRLGARMQPFAGYNMPVEYSGINDEHRTVREKAGVFDVSHMGEFHVSGPGSQDFLQYVTSNDINRLSDGMVQYTCLPNGKGGIVDDLLVYRFSHEEYMLVVNAANIEKDWEWLAGHARGRGLVVGRDLYDASDETALLAVQGPAAMKTMEKLTGEPLSQMKFYTFRVLEIAGIKNAIFSVTGYTGSGGCEIYIANEDGPALWDAVFDAGKEFGIKPAGLGARDTLRLEMGFCLYGNDIDETTSPVEAGLGWITRFSEGNDFIDRELLFHQKTEGVKRKLVAFIMQERGIPRKDYEIADATGNIIGRVTSGTMSPMMGKGIGMGYVTPEYAGEGSAINILIRNRPVRAEVVRPPIYREKKQQ